MSQKKYKSLDIHHTIKEPLLEFAKARGYPVCFEILSRGSKDNVLVESVDEALLLGILSDAYRDDVRLRYPYYDDEHPLYNPDHEEIFSIANGEIVMTVSFEMQNAFPEHFKTGLDYLSGDSKT